MKNEVDLDQLNRFRKSNPIEDFLNHLYPDLADNVEAYEFIRINLGSIMAYDSFLQNTDTSTTLMQLHLKMNPIILAIGEFFKCYPEHKHSDYTKYGFIPCKKNKSKFGKLGYTAPHDLLNPERMDNVYRTAILGDNSTCIYSFNLLLNWLHKNSVEFAKDLTKEELEEAIPITHEVLKGYHPVLESNLNLVSADHLLSNVRLPDSIALGSQLVSEIYLMKSVIITTTNTSYLKSDPLFYKGNTKRESNILQYLFREFETKVLNEIRLVIKLMYNKKLTKMEVLTYQDNQLLVTYKDSIMNEVIIHIRNEFNLPLFNMTSTEFNGYINYTMREAADAANKAGYEAFREAERKKAAALGIDICLPVAVPTLAELWEAACKQADDNSPWQF